MDGANTGQTFFGWASFCSHFTYLISRIISFHLIKKLVLPNKSKSFPSYDNMEPQGVNNDVTKVKVKYVYLMKPNAKAQCANKSLRDLIGMKLLEYKNMIPRVIWKE